MGILFIINELWWVVNPRERLQNRQLWYRLRKQYKDVKWDSMPEQAKTETIKRLFNLMVLLWMFLGLFTFNWFAFVVQIILNVAILERVSTFTGYGKTWMIVRWFAALWGVLWGVFIILNSYHLKIDLFEHFWIIITN